MKIGIVCPYSFDEPGGVQAHILDLARKLLDRGHQVRVLGPGTATDLPAFVTCTGRSVPIPYNGSVARLAFGPHAWCAVRKFLHQGNFDVLHIHEPNSPSLSMIALRVSECPVVATYHASSSGSWLLKLALPFLRSSLEKIHGGIAVSEMARRWQVEQLGGDPVLIPNGVDTAQFAGADTSSPPSQRPIELVFLGRIDEPRKGLKILLQALDRLDRHYHLTVIGGGTPIPAPHVDYVGRVSDDRKAALLGQADIYIAPNTGGESFGIVLVEAMAAGCAVVASDLEAFRAVCATESNQPAGLVFRNEDAGDLRRCLQLLIDDPAQRHTYVEAGKARAEIYDWDRVVVEILRVYETVASGKTAGIWH